MIRGFVCSRQAPHADRIEKAPLSTEFHRRIERRFRPLRGPTGDGDFIRLRLYSIASIQLTSNPEQSGRSNEFSGGIMTSVLRLWLTVVPG
jgi:hypothetical protein